MAEPEAFDEFVLSIARETWSVFRREPLLFVLASLGAILLSVCSLGLIAGPVWVGFIDMIRRSKDNEPLAFGMLFSRFDILVPSLVASAIVGIAVMIGIFMLVLPGLLIALFTCFTLQAIAYESLSGIEAIQRSIAIVRGHFVHVLALILLISVLHAVGGVVLIGGLITTPLSIIALTLGYERLAKITTPAALQV